MRNKIVYAIAVCSVVVVVAALVGYRMFYGSAVEKGFKLNISKEDNYAAVVERVKRSINHDMAFDFYAKRINLENTFKTGRYTIEEGMTVIDIARMLKFGSNATVRLTINNARTVEALAGRISQQLDIDSAEMVKLLRSDEMVERMGYKSPEAMFSMFLPNTYEVFPDITAEELVLRLKDESDKFWAKDSICERLAAISLTPYEVMTLASIVHEETNAVDEMPRVAGVYMNRLRKGMPLQADPTVKYAVGDPALKRILYRHLEVDSPYNTYKYLGLPPTPIAMPDMAAIEAVLNYEQHDYYYFCARPEMDGRHNFARTHAEHERNAAEYHRALNKMKIR